MQLKSLHSRWSRASAINPGAESPKVALCRSSLIFDVVMNIFEFADAPTLAIAARLSRACRLKAERLLYQSVFVSKVTHVHALARALADPSNHHRAAAIQHLTVVYIAARPVNRKRGIAAVNRILDNAPNLLYLDINFWSPHDVRYKWWHYIHPPKNERISSRMAAINDQNRRSRWTPPHPSTRVFEVPPLSVLKPDQWAEILDKFLRSTSPSPSLIVCLNCRFPRHIIGAVKQLSSLRCLEIWVPEWALCVGSEDVFGDSSFSWASLISKLPCLETFRLVGMWIAWLGRNEEQAVSDWGQICPSLRCIAFDPCMEWVRESDDGVWQRRRITTAPFKSTFF